MKAASLALGAASAGALVMFAACGTFMGADDPTPDAASDAGADDTSLGDAKSDGWSDASDDGEASVLSANGCSDGTREAYGDAPSLAACDGYWTEPGITTTTSSTCDRRSGNSGMTTSGIGCSATDLCALGWHVCKDHVDVAISQQGSGAAGPCEATEDPDGGHFYATAQTSGGAASCDSAMTSGADDIFGCGDLGSKPDPVSCAPLNARVSSDHLPKGWLVDTATTERTTAKHTNGPGGVLCCKD